MCFEFILNHFKINIKLNLFMLSFWEYDSFFKNLDVAIIGSGIVGLNAALTLKEQQPDWNIAVVERSFLPYGASTRNAGFACFGSITELLEDLGKMSEDEVFGVVEQRFAGLQRLRSKIGDAVLQYEPLGGMEIFKASEQEFAQNAYQAMPYLNHKLEQVLKISNIYSAVHLNEIQRFGFKNITDVIKNNYEGQIDTGAMMRALIKMASAKGITLLNGLDVQNIKDETNEVVITTAQQWHFTAERVLVCTNGFTPKILPNVAVTPARNQVFITKPISNLRFKGAFHYQQGYYYFRNVDNRILIGGGRNVDFATEQTDELATTPIIQDALHQLMKDTILPDQPYEVDMVWSGIMGLGDSKSPIIEKVSPNIGVAVRMGGMGVAIGSLVGEKGAALIAS